MKKNKPESWKQDSPQDQFTAIVGSIIGLSLNVQEFSSNPLTINRGKALQAEAEKLMRLKSWIKNKW